MEPHCRQQDVIQGKIAEQNSFVSISFFLLLNYLLNKD